MPLPLYAGGWWVRPCMSVQVHGPDTEIKCVYTHTVNAFRFAWLTDGLTPSLPSTRNSVFRCRRFPGLLC